MTELTVLKTSDFAVTGDGRAAAWATAPWVPLARVGTGKATYATRAKVLYSDTGLYFLTDSEDRRLTCTLTEDFANIFTEDVIEVFLWPDEAQPLYLEYEISPLNVELPILVPNHGGTFFGWRPWHYEGPRLTRRATAAQGGPKASMATVTGWSAEFFLPFALFTGLGNTPPRSGNRWRANIYRIDYDETPASQWAWCPDTGGQFHDFGHFGTFRFE